MAGVIDLFLCGAEPRAFVALHIFDHFVEGAGSPELARGEFAPTGADRVRSLLGHPRSRHSVLARLSRWAKLSREMASEIAML